MVDEAEAISLAEPKVFIGIATGPAKEYAVHQMVASLRRLDWSNMEIHWSTTHFGNRQSTIFRDELVKLMDTVDWSCDWHVHTTHVDANKPDYVRYNPKDPAVASYYDPVIKNLRLLRGEFLDGDCDYFLELGGDNPCFKNTVEHLMSLDVDVAFALCYQRPREKRSMDAGYPLVYVYSWTPAELEKFGLEPLLMEKFRLAWANTPMVIPLVAVKNWKRKKSLSKFASGTGCVLIKRHVLERVGWRLPPSRYFSEDLYFCHQCSLHGYSMKIDLRFHCPHFHEDGKVY